MKMVKSLLLGTAAGLVAVAGAQAADLPVKAKPVEYVKICTLYGDGFYYIPGTDTCLKLGGYVRADYGYNVRGARTMNYSGVLGAHDRTTSDFSTRHRANVQIDTRTQTAYGTLRTFESIHVSNENEGTVDVQVARAFIQWAGFTFGRTASFTDPPGSMGDSGFRSIFQTQNQSDSGANGTNQIAYTWELGNGSTLSIGADERRVGSVTNLSQTAVGVGSDPGSSRHGNQHPNPWVSFKVNQAWGQFGTAFIGNKNNATYYGATPGITGYAPSGACVAQPQTTFCTYPDDKWGWAWLTGIEIKLPWIAPGDRIGGYFNYGVGAVRYSAGSNLRSPGLFEGGNNVGVGTITDTVYVNGSQQEQTTAWTAAAAYEHYWTSNFSTTVYGTYTQLSYSDTVVNSRWFCGGGGARTPNMNLTAAANAAGVSCDPGFNFWTVGTHTDWFPVAGFRLGVDVQWTQIETAYAGQTLVLNTSQGARPTGLYTAKDEGILGVIFRAQRSFPAGR
jgi:hypothetical protein